MLVCYTSDLHGSQRLYSELDNLVADARPDVVILGGDLFADGEDDDPVGGQQAYVNDVFLPRIRRWRSAASQMRVACLPGNHDWVPTTDLLRRHAGDGAWTLLESATPWRVGTTALLGFCHTPWTPHSVKDYERLDMLGDPLPETGGEVWDEATHSVRRVTAAEHFAERPTLAEKLAAAPQLAQPWIFVCHAPPRDTNLDRLPNLDHPIGSSAVRQFIEKRRPLLALHGHVHESPDVTGAYTDTVGGVLCVNPGQSFDRLHAVLFELEQPTTTLRHTVFG